MTRNRFTPIDYATSPPKGQKAVDAWCRANGCEPGDVAEISWNTKSGSVIIETLERDPTTGSFMIDNPGTPEAEVVRCFNIMADKDDFPWAAVEDTP